MIKDNLDNILKNQSANLKKLWQIFFAIGAICFIFSLYHFFSFRPKTKTGSIAFSKNIDIMSFILAITLAFIILNLKRKYFSKKHLHKTAEHIIQNFHIASDQKLMNNIFIVLKQKLLIIWLLGALIILDGIIYYWIFFEIQNMNIYFFVGAFSLFLNYPRRELFDDIPWVIRQTRFEIEKKQDKPGE
jgi:uncharacterized membrane protein